MNHAKAYSWGLERRDASKATLSPNAANWRRRHAGSEPTVLVKPLPSPRKSRVGVLPEESIADATGTAGARDGPALKLDELESGSLRPHGVECLRCHTEWQTRIVVTELPTNWRATCFRKTTARASSTWSRLPDPESTNARVARRRKPTAR